MTTQPYYEGDAEGERLDLIWNVRGQETAQICSCIACVLAEGK